MTPSSARTKRPAGDPRRFVETSRQAGNGQESDDSRVRSDEEAMRAQRSPEKRRWKMSGVTEKDEKEKIIDGSALGSGVTDSTRGELCTSRLRTLPESGPWYELMPRHMGRPFLTRSPIEPHRWRLTVCNAGPALTVSGESALFSLWLPPRQGQVDRVLIG